MKRLLITIAMFVCLMLQSLPVLAEGDAPLYEESQPSDTTVAAETRNGTDDGMATGDEVLSTELSGLDSLDLAPAEYETRSSGGTRRTTLETTIFRRQDPVAYSANGERDPFRALIVDEKKEGEIKTDLLRLEDAILTGVIWSEGQYLAMVKDKDGKNFFLRSGDKIYNGNVVSVSQTNAVFEVSEFGDYSRVTLNVQS